MTNLAREENILIPAFEAQTGNSMGPTQIMRMEHQQIRDLVIGVAYQVVPMFQITPPYPLLLGVLFIGGFAVSVVSGMLYKIVPFLAWFHLQAQLQARAGSIPTMKEMIAERWKCGQFRIHVFACVLLVAAVFNPPALALPAGITLGLSALFLWVNLLSAVRRFTSRAET